MAEYVNGPGLPSYSGVVPKALGRPPGACVGSLGIGLDLIGLKVSADLVVALRMEWRRIILQTRLKY